MRIHTSVLSPIDVYGATNDAHIASDVHPVVMSHQGSRKRRGAYEVQLGTYDKTSGPTRSRRYKNTGTHGAGYGYDRIWAATYDEWGWFLANLFAIDPDAIAGPYNGVDDFHAQTKGAFKR